MANKRNFPNNPINMKGDSYGYSKKKQGKKLPYGGPRGCKFARSSAWQGISRSAGSKDSH